MRAFQNGADEIFFGSGGASAFESIARNAERFAAYISAALGAERFSDILRSAAGISAFFGNSNGGREVSAAYREVINGDSGSRSFFADPEINNESAINREYLAEFVTARFDLFKTAYSNIRTVTEYARGENEVAFLWGGSLEVNNAAMFGNSSARTGELLVNFAARSENDAAFSETNLALSAVGAAMSGLSADFLGKLPLISNKVSSGYEIRGFISKDAVLESGGFDVPLSAGVQATEDLMSLDSAFAAADAIGGISAVMFGGAVGCESGGMLISGSNGYVISAGGYGSEFYDKTSVSHEAAQEDMQFLRESAARYSIKQYIEGSAAPPAEGNVVYSNGNVDFDSIADHFINGVKTAIECAAEGVHI